MPPSSPEHDGDGEAEAAAAARIVGLYHDHAGHFAEDRSTALFERAWLDAFLALVPPGGRVLDVGCGTGVPIAAYLAGRGHPVTGVDAAPAMIERCRATGPDGDWQVADMRSLALGRTFAGVLAWDSLFHLDHAAQRRTLPRLAAHAAPGAPLMFTSGPAHGTALGTYRGEPLFHASLSPAEYRALLARCGFTELRHVAEDRQCGGRTIWLAQRT